MRHSIPTKRVTMRLSALAILLSLTAIRAQSQLTSTFLSLPLPSIPSMPPSIVSLPQLPSASSSSSTSVSSSASLPAAIPIASMPLPTGAPANTSTLPPPPMVSWEVLPEGVPRTKSGKPIPCSPKNTKLNPTTHKLISECVETTFCSAPPGAPVNATGLGVCLPRLCRRDEFPFGYGTYGGGSGGGAVKKVKGKKGQSTNATAVVLPPMCGVGTFCPDDGSGCRLQEKMGEVCQLDRDEQCEAPPPDPSIPESQNKAVCLNRRCMAATLPLGIPCVIENTTYVGDINHGAAGGGQFTTVVIKHNCLSPGLFCDPTPPNVNEVGAICQPTKKLGQKCRFDAECEMQNCLGPSKRCAPPAETPLRVAPWHWVATILFIVVSMITIFFVLVFMHKRRRFGHYQQLQTYYFEQINLRRSILALHAAAAEQQHLTTKVPAEKGE